MGTARWTLKVRILFKERQRRISHFWFVGPLYQNKVKCSAFDMEMIFHSHAHKTHFHKKGCALGLDLKVRVFGTQKWPIEPRINGQYIALQHIHQHPQKELWHLIQASVLVSMSIKM